MDSDQTAPDRLAQPAPLSSRTESMNYVRLNASPSSDVEESSTTEYMAGHPTTAGDIAMSGVRRRRAPPPANVLPTARRHLFEAVLIVCIAAAVLLRMWTSGIDVVRNKVLQLVALVGGSILICAAHWGTPYTICSTPVRYWRRFEPADPLYVAIVPPFLAASMLFGTATGGAMAPPPIGQGAGVWWTEYISGFKHPIGPLEAKALGADLHALVSQTILTHIVIAAWQQKRVGPRFEERRAVPALCSSYVLSSLLVLCVSLAAKALGGGVFFANLHYSQVFIGSALCQGTLLMWSRVGQRNFTLGELAVSCGFIVLMSFETVSLTASSLWPAVRLYVCREPTVILAFQLALIVGMLLIGFLLSPLLVLSRSLAQRPIHRLRWPEKRDLHRRLLALAFFGFTVLIIVGVIGMWMRVMLGNRDPWFYVIRALFQGARWWSRPALLAYWAFMCNGALLFVQLIVNRVWKFATLGDSMQKNTAVRWGTSRLDSLPARRTSQQSLRPTVPLSINARRKFFHLCAVLMFVPGAALDPAFMHLAFSAGCSLFLLLEFLRYYAVYPVGAGLHFFLSQFLDSKDTGLLILSHTYLLCGCAVGLWFDGRARIAQQLGTLLLGVGDTLASVVGRRIGRHKWPGSKKSVEGSGAFVLSVLLAARALQAVGWVDTLPLGRFAGIVTALAVLEGVSEQNDNLILPSCGLVLCVFL